MNKSQIRKSHETEQCTFCGGRKITTWTHGVGVYVRERRHGKCPSCKGEGVKYKLPSGFWDINYVVKWHKEHATT